MRWAKCKAQEIQKTLPVGDALRQSSGTTSLVVGDDQTLSASGNLKLTEMMHGVNINLRTGGLPATAPTDMILLIQNASGGKGGGWSSIVVPKGATLRNLADRKFAVTFGKEL